MQCPQGHQNSNGVTVCRRCGYSFSRENAAMLHPFGPGGSALSTTSADTETLARDAPKSKRTKLLVGAAVVAVGLAGSAIALDRHDRPLVRGVVDFDDLSGNTVEGPWDDCAGTGRSAGLRSGMKLTFKDEDGDTVGSGRVRSMTKEHFGEVSESPYGSGKESLETAIAFLESQENHSCQLYFSARVDEADIYSISLAGWGGQYIYSKEDLVFNDYWFFLSLNNS